MQMQTKPLLPVSLRQPPQTHLCLSLSLAVCASLSLSLCATVSASHTLPPRGHSAQTGTKPDLLCHTGLAKRSLSLHTPDSPHILSSERLWPSPPPFSGFILHHSWDPHFESMPSNQPEKNNATTTTAGEQIKHSHIWMLGLLCNHTEGKTKLSINNVTSRHCTRYQVHSTGVWTSIVSPEMYSILYIFMNQHKKVEFEPPCWQSLHWQIWQYNMGLPAHSKLFLIEDSVRYDLHCSPQPGDRYSIYSTLLNTNKTATVKISKLKCQND